MGDRDLAWLLVVKVFSVVADGWKKKIVGGWFL